MTEKHSAGNSLCAVNNNQYPEKNMSNYIDLPPEIHYNFPSVCFSIYKSENKQYLYFTDIENFENNYL